MAGCSSLPNRMIRNEPLAFADFNALNPAKQEKVVSKIATELKSRNPETQCKALYALGKLGPGAGSAVPEIVLAVNNSKLNCQTNAAYALGKIGGAAVAGLIELLKSTEPLVRSGAAWALGNIGPASGEAVQFLTEALKDKDNSVRYYAAEAIGKINVSGLTALVEALGDKNVDVSNAAAHSLIVIGGPAIPELIKTLRRDEPLFKINAAVVLGGIGPSAKEAVPALEEALQAADSEVKHAVLNALVLIGADLNAHLPELISVLSEKEGDAKMRTFFALTKVNGEYIPLLVTLLRNENPGIRANTAWALGIIGPSAVEAAPVLVNALYDADHLVREAAASSLGKIGSRDTGTVNALIKALKDPDFSVGHNAAAALAKIGDSAVPELLRQVPDKGLPYYKANQLRETLRGIFRSMGASAVPALLEGIRQKDEGIRDNAYLGLRSIAAEAKDAVPALAGSLNDENATVRMLAAGTLGTIGSQAKEALPGIIVLLKDTDFRVRSSAAQAIVGIGAESKQAIPGLIGMVGSNDQRDNISASIAIGSIGPEAKSAVPALILMLKNKDINVSEHAAEALGKIGPEAKAAIPGLKELMKDRPSLRAKAVWSLFKISGSKEGVKLYESGLKSKDPEIRDRTVKNLAEIDPTDGKAVPLLREKLKGQDIFGRIEALRVLNKMGTKAKPALPEIIAVLKDNRDDEAMRLAGEILSKFGSESAVAIPVFIEFMNSKYRNYQDYSANMLSKIGVPAIPALVDRLKNGETDTKEAAATALGKIGPAAKDAIPALIETTKTVGNHYVKQAAVRAIMLIDPAVKENSDIKKAI